MNPLLLPVAAVQGLRVRRTTEVLPPADGPTSGTCPPTGDGRAADGRDPLRVAVLGESTAAGCGVARHEEGLAGSLAKALAGRTGRPVQWSVHGRSGATLRRIRHRLLPEVASGLDAAVLLAGVNDVLARRSAREWGTDLAAVVDALAGRARRVVVAGVPPFAQFPSLPGTLRRYLAERAAQLDAVSQRVCADADSAVWVASAGSFRTTSDFFARDRFHPSARGYAEWARLLAPAAGR